MKIETFTKGSVVVVIFFVLGLTLMGEGILQQKFGVDDAPLFGKVTNYQSDLDSIKEDLEGQTLTSNESGLVDSEGGTFDEYGYNYIKRALKAVSLVIKGPDSSRSAITEVLKYLKVNHMIVTGILTILVLSFVLALVAWWKSRRV